MPCAGSFTIFYTARISGATVARRGRESQRPREARMPEPRLSPLDASFLEVESATAHMHVGWAATFLPPEDGPRPTFEDLRDHIAARLGRAPRYRQRLARVPLGLREPAWIDDDDFDLDHHLLHARSPDLAGIVDAVMSVPLERDRPLWEMWIAPELEDGSIGLVGKAHHCMVDGIAAVELATMLLDMEPDPAPADSAGWRPRPAPSRLELLARAATERAAQQARLLQLPLDLLRSPSRVFDLPAMAVDLGRTLSRSLFPLPPRPAADLARS